MQKRCPMGRVSEALRVPTPQRACCGTQSCPECPGPAGHSLCPTGLSLSCRTADQEPWPGLGRPSSAWPWGPQLLAFWVIPKKGLKPSTSSKQRARAVF